MAESLNEPFEKPKRRTFTDRDAVRYATLVAALIVLGVFVAIFFAFFGNTVTLSGAEFTCTKPTATNRYRFDRPETCDQYTRRPEMTRNW